MSTPTELTFTQGSTANSRNAIYKGYRYGNPNQLKSGYTSWECVLKKCKGRIHTIGDGTVEVTRVHKHEPSIEECQVKLAMNAARQLAATTRTEPTVIMADTTTDLSDVARALLPNKVARTKQIWRARHDVDGRPRAPTSVIDMNINPSDCITSNG